ncbi:MAG: glycosyltransferase family 39 protein [bacterium]
MRIKGREILAVIILLITFFVQALFSMRQKSPTYDEIQQLPCGYTHWMTGKFNYGLGHTPLVRLICSLPHIFMDINLPPLNILLDRKNEKVTDYNIGLDYLFGKSFIYRYNRNADNIIFWGRFPVLLVTLILGLYIFIWARKFYGAKAGLMALFLFSFSPNMLAFSRFIITDIVMITFGFISMYYLYQFLQDFNAKDFILMSVFCGLALISKFTAILLLLIIVPVMFYFKNLKQLRQKLKYSILFLVIVWVVICAGYFFQEPIFLRDVSYNEISDIIPGSLFDKPLFYFLSSLPLPDFYLKGILNTIHRNNIGFPSFLIGEYSITGWPHYYLVVLLLKLPLVSILLGVLTFLSLFRVRVLFKELFLLAPIMLYFLFNSFSRIQTGMQYLIPIIPFYLVLVSRIVNWKSIETLKFKKIYIVILSCFYVYSSLNAYPNYLTYFNEIVESPVMSYKYLLGSNNDLGQDLKGLAVYVDKIDHCEVILCYFGTADPSYYGIKYQSLLSDNTDSRYIAEDYPLKELLAISITNLQSLYFNRKGVFDWLKHYKIDKNIGNTIIVYDITGDEFAHYQLGRIYLMSNEYEKALRESRRIRIINPNSKGAKLIAEKAKIAVQNADRGIISQKKKKLK